MPELTPAEIADQNLRHLCAVTGATYSPDHKAYSPMGNIAYPGPWVRIVLQGTEFYICAQYIIKMGPSYRSGTCFYLSKTYEVNEAVTGEKTPYAEQVASALLLLRNDPSIFDRWAQHNGPYA